MHSTDRIDPGRPGADDVPVLPLGTDQQTDTSNDATANLAHLLTIDAKTASTFAMQLQMFGRELESGTLETLEAIGMKATKSIHGLFQQVDVIIRERTTAAEHGLETAQRDLQTLEAKPLPVADEHQDANTIIEQRTRALEAARTQITSQEMRVRQAEQNGREWTSARLGLLTYIAVRTQAAIARLAPEALETAVA